MKYLQSLFFSLFFIGCAGSTDKYVHDKYIGKTIAVIRSESGHPYFEKTCDEKTLVYGYLFSDESKKILSVHDVYGGASKPRLLYLHVINDNVIDVFLLEGEFSHDDLSMDICSFFAKQKEVSK